MDAGCLQRFLGAALVTLAIAASVVTLLVG
jgi:hypothetical protein